MAKVGCEQERVARVVGPKEMAEIVALWSKQSKAPKPATSVGARVLFRRPANVDCG